ncbi:MAG: prepilin-type N-terminal cleavage/methylation domain-containing protein [Candidatus Acidiferrales bacterium]
MALSNRQSPAGGPRTSARGFTLMEVLFSILVLSIGIMALTSLVAQMATGTDRSRFLSLASTYASEKLEDLNRYPTWDPHLCVASGGTAGSLTSDVQATVGTGPTTLTGAAISCSGTSQTVDYYDDVQIADSNGEICETIGAAPSFTTTCHMPNGVAVPITTSATATAEETGTISFHRRWTIEMDQPVTGVKRVTVLVTLNNAFMNPGVSFQMSMVRP